MDIIKLLRIDEVSFMDYTITELLFISLSREMYSLLSFTSLPFLFPCSFFYLFLSLLFFAFYDLLSFLPSSFPFCTCLSVSFHSLLSSSLSPHFVYSFVSTFLYKIKFSDNTLHFVKYVRHIQ